MAVPSYQSFKETKVSVGTLLTIIKPDSTVEGDLMIAFITNSLATTNGISTPSGWTQVQGISGYLDTYCFYKVAGASEAGFYTFSCSPNRGMYGVIIRITGHNATSPINISAINTGTSASPTCPSVTTTVDDCLVLRLFGADENNITVDSGEPSGTTLITVDENGNEDLNKCCGGAAYEEQVSSSATGTAAFSMTASEQWVAITVAIAPAGTQVSSSPSVSISSSASITPSASPSSSLSRTPSASISSSPSASPSASVSTSPSASISSSPSSSASVTPSASVSSSPSSSPSSSISSSASGTASASPSSSISASPSVSPSASISSSPSRTPSASPSASPSSSLSKTPSASISASPSSSASRTPSASPSTSVSSSPSRTPSASISSSPSASLSASPSSSPSASISSSPSVSPSASISSSPSASISSSPSGTPSGSPSSSASASPSTSPSSSISGTPSTTDYGTYTGGGTAQEVENTWTNLDHLEGETVVIQGTDINDITTNYDDEVVSTATVTLVDGTTNNFVKQAVIGLSNRCTLQPMRIDITGDGGTTHGSIMKIAEIVVSLYKSRDVYYGSSLDDLHIIPETEDTEFTGDAVLVFDGGFTTETPIYISSNSPFQCVVRAIIPRVQKVGR